MGNKSLIFFIKNMKFVYKVLYGRPKGDQSSLMKSRQRGAKHRNDIH